MVERACAASNTQCDDWDIVKYASQDISELYGDNTSDDWSIRGSELLSVACCHVRKESPNPPVLRIIIDSGASAHMFPVNRLLYEVNVINGWVSLGDNSKHIVISGVGKTTIDILGPVLHLLCGLISIPTLNEVGCMTVMC